jgi:ADP-ribosylglycohydrolase
MSPMDTAPALARAQLSLEGLSVGDAFGELYMSMYPRLSRTSSLPAGPWLWTDDTHMALSVVEILRTCGRIDQDVLASAFARRYECEPYRGYAGGAARLLEAIVAGADWRDVSPKLFGSGSYGNGAAMRAAPIGGYLGGDPGWAAHEAQLSAVVTHWHPEGQAGAMAVAVAAAIAAGAVSPSGAEFLRQVSAFLPACLTQERILEAVEIPPDQPADAIRMLGTGQQVSAQDTVPFCLWVAAHNLHDFEEALWCTVEGTGDADTTCAIVGGIVALSAPEIPAEWIARREPLPPL